MLMLLFLFLAQIQENPEASKSSLIRGKIMQANSLWAT